MSRKREVATLGMVLFLVALAFSDALLSGKSFFVRDVARIYYPERAALREIVRSGSFPFWNPHYSSGQPAAANPTYEVFYPPQWLVLLPDFLLGVKLEIVLHFLIAAAGMFCLLRALRLRLPAAAFGAVVYPLGGMMLSLACLLPCLFAFAWIPWLGLFVRRTTDLGRRRDVAAAALVLGVISLIGEPASLLQACALTGAYAIYRCGLRGARMALAIGFLALLIGAAQIVPAIDHQRDSGRREPLAYDTATDWSLAPARPLELIAPELFGHIDHSGIYFWATDHPSGAPWLFSWYAGLLTAALIVAGFIHRVRGWRFVAATALVSYAISLGSHSPLFRLIYLAGLRFLRYPEKWFMSAELVLIVFAAVSADRFLEDRSLRRTTFLTSVAFLVVAGGALASAYSPLFVRFWHVQGADVEAHAQLGAVTMLATAAALALILLLRERVSFALALLALFTLADLLPRGNALAPRISDAYYTPPAIARALPPHSRIYNDAAWEIATVSRHVDLSFDQRWMRVRNGMLPELQELAGLDGLLEPDITLTNLTPARAFLNLFLTARFHGRRELVPMLLSFAGATHSVLLRDAASPDAPAVVVALPGNVRYYIAGQLAEVRRIGETHSWPPRIAFVDHPFTPAGGEIVSVEESANTVDLDIVARGDTALVLGFTPHKYWRATIDGAPAQPYAANVGFQALTVPLGRHHVAFRYRNPLVVACAAVSLVSALALIAATLRSRAPRSP